MPLPSSSVNRPFKPRESVESAPYARRVLGPVIFFFFCFKVLRQTVPRHTRPRTGRIVVLPLFETFSVHISRADVAAQLNWTSSVDPPSPSLIPVLWSVADRCPKVP